MTDDTHEHQHEDLANQANQEDQADEIHMFVPLKEGGLALAYASLRWRRDTLTPELVSQVVGLTVEDKRFLRRFIRNHEAWEASEQAELLAALEQVPELSEDEWLASWKNVAEAKVPARFLQSGRIEWR